MINPERNVSYVGGIMAIVLICLSCGGSVAWALKNIREAFYKQRVWRVWHFEEFSTWTIGMTIYVCMIYASIVFCSVFGVFAVTLVLYKMSEIGN